MPDVALGLSIVDAQTKVLASSAQESADYQADQQNARNAHGP
jgi:hypothetical protein